ncbi:MAG TPA: FAD-dependent oxidoreductase [Pseudonocardiaceae bacterium]|jgi:aklavinone 12-hydroxylase|nr:FAD-dependent oxidoreductase [Pseudonocardiaceae bacterium]
MTNTWWAKLPADELTQVLVVGAGLAGLSTAMFLARRGVDVVVVERHASTSPHPRASGQPPHTMELLRVAGIADEVRAASFGLDQGLVIRIAESVHGRVFTTIMQNYADFDTSALSPAPWGMATQDRVEPIMAARAELSGASIRFSTEVVGVEQDADGVSVRLLDRWSERLSTVRADYLVAADGHRSPIRERLGIARHGPGSLGSLVGVLFEAELTRPTDEGAAALYYLRNKHFTGAFGRTAEENRYIFACDYHPERGESLADFTQQRLTELIRIALDEPDLAPHLLSVQSWEMAARVAEKFRVGRIFLAGDAAKVTPPTGGLGGNTAIGDGYDLGWKLAAVLHGEAGAGLLDSYQPERRPYAEQVVNLSLHNAKARLNPELDLTGLPEPLDMFELSFGYRVRSEAVLISDNDPAPAEDPHRPSGRPGFRAPHVRLLRDGVELSTIDLFGDGWVLLTAEAGGLWHEAARHTASRLGVPLVSHGLGADLADPDGLLTERYGIDSSGASLVRPDGVIAWRCEREPADPAGALRTALSQLLCRTVPAAVPAA